MIIATCKIANNFKDVCYLLSIFILKIAQFVTNSFTRISSHDHYARNFLFISLFNGIATLIFLYFLVGHRIILIHLTATITTTPEYNSSSNYKHDLIEFIPMKSLSRYQNLIKKYNNDKDEEDSSNENDTIELLLKSSI